MALDADNLQIYRTGIIAVAPVGTTAPTTFSGALNAAYIDLGYLGDNDIEDGWPIEEVTVRALQNGEVVKRITRRTNRTLKMTILEVQKKIAIQVFYPGADISVDLKTVTISDHDGSVDWAMVIDRVNDDGVGVRDYFPKVSLIVADPVTYGANKPAAYACSFGAVKYGGVLSEHFYESALVDGS